MQTSVTELLRAEDGRVTGVRLRDKDGNVTEETANIVVGADGRTGIVARSVEPATRDEHEIHGSGFYAYFDDFDYSSVAAGFFDGAFVFAFPTGPRSACIGTEIGLLHQAVIRDETEATFFGKLQNDEDLCARVTKAKRDGRWHTGELTNGFFRHATGPGWALVGDAACTKDPLLGHGITDAFIGAELLAAAIHEDALDRYDDSLWRHLGPVYEASRDAAIDLDVSADELFAAVMPAQLLIREEADMVLAGGPSLT
jgi:flavin-dependent dehydrogenase